MLEATDRQTILDEEHLRLLSVFYFVDAGMSAFFSLIGLFYVGMGVVFFRAIPRGEAGQGAPPPELAWLFGVIGLVFLAVFMTFALLKLATGLQMRKRRSRVFCMVVAGLTCLGFPYGTVLGIFTFVVLVRPSVVKLFDQSPQG
jgi:hypothetical protein